MYKVVLLTSAAVLGAVWLWKSRRNSRLYRRIPGPKGLPVIGVTHKLKPVTKVHLILSDWTSQYGNTMAVNTISGPFVLVSDYEGIYEVTVKKGMIYGGRLNNHRTDIMFQNTGILFAQEPDDIWKGLRKASQKHFKQFGDGMSKLESVISEVAEDMLERCSEFSSDQEEIDPRQVVFDTALCSIAFLITGQRARPGDTIVERMRYYENTLLTCISPFAPLKVILLDFMPWLKWFNIYIAKKIAHVLDFERETWELVKNMNQSAPDSASLCKILMSHVGTDEGLLELDAQKTSMSLLFAGVTTTSNTFYAAINILAHHPEIQSRLLGEIHEVCAGGEVSLTDRPSMPYTRAFILELLRYTSVVPLSVPHKARTGATIQGHSVPKGIRIQINIWHLHHDPEFWRNPHDFIPERFLDAFGELVPADHPNRKHLMPFGAGPRVCLGETLALSRLFLWTVRLVNNFKVVPAKDNLKRSMDARNYSYHGVLEPCDYKVVFHKRLD